MNDTAGNDRFNALVDSIQDSVYILDHDFRHVVVNDAAARFTGYTKQELLGSTLAELFPGVEQTDFYGCFERVMQTRNQETVLNSFTFPDGRTGWYEVHVYPIPEGILCISRDITDQKNAEIEREQHLKELELITETIIAISRMDDVDGICSYLVDRIADHNPGTVVFVSLYDPSIGAIRLRSTSGFPPMLERVLDRFGLRAFQIRIKPEEMVSDTSLYASGKLEHVSGGIYDLAEHRIPRSVCRTIERVIGLGSVHTVGFALDGTPRGGITLFVPRGSDVRMRYAIETIARYASQLFSRMSAELASTESEERFRVLVETAPVSILMVREGKYVFSNPEAARMLGYDTPEEIVGTDPMETIAPEYRELVAERMERIGTGENNEFAEFKLINAKGKTVWTNSISIPVEMHGERAAIVVGRDTTDEKRLETERRRLRDEIESTRKLESIGRLAGGIAHDLNNLLAPIVGYSELLLDELDPEDPRSDSVQEIRLAGDRAKDLVQQLLAFGRKQALEFRRVDINTILEGLSGLLRRTIRENVEIRMELAPGLPVILGDAGQLEQVIMNLAINSQEAMHGEGVLTIETREVTGGSSHATSEVEDTVDRFVELSVTDTGTGIDADTREHLFEPFFTTKRGSGGTGLGLATVYGIVKQHGGTIEVADDYEGGARFDVRLPVAEDVEAAPDPSADDEHHHTASGGNETILLVEDNPQVRTLSTEILKRAGYTVLEASDGNEAIGMMKHALQPVHLLVSDVVMPNLDGRQLYDKISSRHPEIKVLFMSGYTDDVIAHHGALEDGIALIQKPFSVAAFTTKVREVLDS